MKCSPYLIRISSTLPSDPSHSKKPAPKSKKTKYFKYLLKKIYHLEALRLAGALQ